VILQASERTPGEELHRRAGEGPPTGLRDAGSAGRAPGRVTGKWRSRAPVHRARRRYRGVSPFPLASLDFRRGLMWFREGDLPAPYLVRRRSAPGAGVRSRAGPARRDRHRPGRSPGRHRPAPPPGASSDDPAYAATLVCVLRAAVSTGKPNDGAPARPARYAELTLRHPEAYADHAADFPATGRRLHPGILIRTAARSPESAIPPASPHCWSPGAARRRIFVCVYVVQRSSPFSRGRIRCSCSHRRDPRPSSRAVGVDVDLPASRRAATRWARVTSLVQTAATRP